MRSGRTQINRNPCSHEQGIVTLLVALLLLTIATLASLAVGKSAYFEQRLTGNDIRSKEAYAAAMHGLDYAMEYLQGGNNISWSPNQLKGATASISLADTDHGQSNTGTQNYSHTLSLTILTDVGDTTVVNVSSTATGKTDQHITRTVSHNVIMVGILSSKGGNAPPIVVEGCMTGVSGTPDIHPGDGGTAVSSLTCDSCGSAPCIDTGNFDSIDSTNSSQAMVTTNINSSDTLWDTLFDITKDQFRSLAAQYPSRMINVWDGYESTGYHASKYTGSTWNSHVGSAAQPVIIFFEKSEGCPKINGNVNVYGMIFYDDDNCSQHGFGMGNVYGTVAISGNMTSHNANTDLHAFQLGSHFGGGGGGAFNFVSVIPGTWKDF